MPLKVNRLSGLLLIAMTIRALYVKGGFKFPAELVLEFKLFSSSEDEKDGEELKHELVVVVGDSGGVTKSSLSDPLDKMDLMEKFDSKILGIVQLVAWFGYEMKLMP